jgi:hypothetical protein
VEDDGGMTVDWSRVRFTEHMTEAAAVVGECHVVLDFDGIEHTTYEVRVLRPLKGASDAAFFAVGVNRAALDGYRPVGEGATPEEAVEACLAAAGVHHRRRLRQRE